MVDMESCLLRNENRRLYRLERGAGCRHLRLNAAQKGTGQKPEKKKYVFLNSELELGTDRPIRHLLTQLVSWSTGQGFMSEILLRNRLEGGKDE